MKKSEIVVNVREVKDAMPIAFLVQTASQFESKIYIDCEDKHVNAKSIMGMMTLTLEKGTKVSVSADGSDEDKALTKIGEFLTGQ
ncbi:MAG: HPr family phosphocarrier protein [Lachnospiraceae bacterium]|nr:HPr family phosphocarrier protein [Lachnospiraceae bacterium]MCR5410425.1 HPr family phosphocarrier protein [Lachnospiraceae bacterium]